MSTSHQHDDVPLMLSANRLQSRYRLTLFFSALLLFITFIVYTALSL